MIDRGIVVIGGQCAIPSLGCGAPIGGGGTDFRPFFRHVAAELEPLAATILVYLTDGEGTFPEQPPSSPALWIVTPGVARCPTSRLASLRSCC